MINDLNDYRWLVSSAAEPWFAASADDPVRLISRLRRQLSAVRAHLVVEQLDLRRRAREKFRLADRMFFTRKGLEQATDEQLATYKSSRFPANRPINDLCCGIGGDLISLCARGPTRGVDRDEVMALLAKANAHVHGFSSAQFTVDSYDIADIPIGDGPWHCDPDRRATGRRATRGELFEPTLDVLDELLQQTSHAAIKLAPATEPPAIWCERAEREWLESRGECRQQVAWFGNLARHPGRHAATVIVSNGQSRTVIGKPNASPSIAIQVGRYLYEPAPAVLAAKLTAELCREHNLTCLNPGVAYLTGDNPIDDLALAGFEIVDILRFDRKQLRAYCRQHNLGRLEIKKRGVEVSPEKLRQEIIAPGDNTATILIAPSHQQILAIIARRIIPKR